MDHDRALEGARMVLREQWILPIHQTKWLLIGTDGAKKVHRAMASGKPFGALDYIAVGRRRRCLGQFLLVSSRMPCQHRVGCQS